VEFLECPDSGEMKRHCTPRESGERVTNDGLTFSDNNLRDVDLIRDRRDVKW
jgi:hypothetical protein